MGQLTDVQIRNWIKAGAAVAKSDGDGLTFTLSAKGTAAWVLRYRVPGAKSQREMTLGRYPDISLGRARELATEARAKVQQGADVARDKQSAKRDSAAAWTVRQLAEDYLKKSEKHLAVGTIDQRRQQLGAHVYPVIGGVAAKDVTPADVVTITERAAAKSLHVGRLVLVALRAVFAHGIARKTVKANPCIDVQAKAVIGPQSDLEKEYRVAVMGELTEEKLELLRFGLELDGRELKPAEVEVISDQRLRFVLREGRNRQIRRMCELVDLKVVDLFRVRIGPLDLGDMPEGRWRPLTAAERAALIAG